MSTEWNANTYSQFIDLRTRPAKDLLSHIPNTFEPSNVYDLGCGPGNSTILLKERWPNANIIGLDSSEKMLERAHINYPNLTFIHNHIEDFNPTEKTDCLFANASLQWLGNHEILIPKLLQCLKPNGFLCIQMPNNFHAPSHQVIIKILQNDPSWHTYLSLLRYSVSKKPLYQLSSYYDLLKSAGANLLQLWETEYFQEMSSHKEIFDWVSGAVLRPILSVMDQNNQTQFANNYIHAIKNEYHLQKNNKILLPFKRLFIIASLNFKVI